MVKLTKNTIKLLQGIADINLSPAMSFSSPVLSFTGHVIKRSTAAVPLTPAALLWNCIVSAPPLRFVCPFNKVFSSLRIQVLVQNQKRVFISFQPEKTPTCILEWFFYLDTLSSPGGTHPRWGCDSSRERPEETLPLSSLRETLPLNLPPPPP